MPTPLKNLFRKKMQEIAAEQTGWKDRFPGTLGDSSGVILTATPGIIQVTNVINGKVYEVHNTLVLADRPGLHVEVGRRVGEIIWRVVRVAEAYGLTTSEGQSTSQTVQDLFVGRERFLPFLVYPTDGGGLVVSIYGDTLLKADGSVGSIANQTLDLSSHVPASGALYCLIEADDNGVVYGTNGTAVAALEILTLADIPAITAGRHASCAVRLYAGQAQLYRDPASINDFVDIRFLHSPLETPQILDDLTDVNSPSPTDNQVLTWDAYAEEWVAATPAGANVGVDIHAATEKPTIHDDDEVGGVDSEAYYTLTKWLWSTVKAWIIDFADLLYAAIGHTHTIFDDTEGDPADLGASASDGTSSYAARRDHVHEASRRWLPFGIYTHYNPLTADLQQPYSATVDRTVTFVSYHQVAYVQTTNDGSNYWKIQLNRASDGAVIAEVSTAAVSADTLNHLSTTTFSIASIGTADKSIYMYVRKTGNPGNLYIFGPSVEVTV